MKKAFTCNGCGKVIVINKDVPQQREFVWTDIKTWNKNSYCYECDDKLIQDVPLPKESNENSRSL